MISKLPPPLLALSPGSLRAGQLSGFVAAVQSAARAGMTGLLLREPHLLDRELECLARQLREEVLQLDWLGIHDRGHLALRPLFDGWHLGFRSLSAAEARRVARPKIVIGFSAHAHDRGPERLDADYLLLGPVFETPSKRGRLAPLGLEGLRREVERCQAPVWALGGISPENCAEVFACGVRGIAVLRGILAAGDPGRAVRAFFAGMPPQS